MQPLKQEVIWLCRCEYLLWCAVMGSKSKDTNVSARLMLLGDVFWTLS